jgi:hypothetical protein
MSLSLTRSESIGLTIIIIYLTPSHLYLIYVRSSSYTNNSTSVRFS